MAVTSFVTCDLHHGDSPKATTHIFSIDNRAYEIDLCPEHLDRFHTVMSEFVEGARRTGNRAAATGRGRARLATTPGAEVSAIREWARRNGMDVSTKGRIPLTIQQAYEASGSGRIDDNDEVSAPKDVAVTQVAGRRGRTAQVKTAPSRSVRGAKANGKANGEPAGRTRRVRVS